MRDRAVLWRLGVLVAWLAGLVGIGFLAAGTTESYILLAVPLTIAVGAVIDRWWVLVVPWIVELVAALVVAVAWLVPDGCNDCDGAALGFMILWFAAVFTIPASVSLFVGVGGRRAARAGRSDRPAPEPI